MAYSRGRSARIPTRSLCKEEEEEEGGKEEEEEEGRRRRRRTKIAVPTNDTVYSVSENTTSQ